MMVDVSDAPAEKQPRAEGCADAYEVGSVLGKGGFATVKLVTRRADGAKFALKVFNKGGSNQAAVEHERSILTLLGLHRHIVSLVDHFVLDGAPTFVMELADGGEVFEQMAQHGAFSEAQAASVMRQVALALSYMHSLHVAHRDLKPENLLLTHEGRAGGRDGRVGGSAHELTRGGSGLLPHEQHVKVADVGMAARCAPSDPPLVARCGTAVYMAPEVASAKMSKCGYGGGYGTAIDLWSLGCVLYALLGGYLAFDPRNELPDKAVMERVRRNEWSFAGPTWAYVSPAAKQLITALLQPEPTKRLTADALLRMPWVSAGGAHSTPLLGSDAALMRFNAGRKVWRAAVAAAALFARTPLAAEHSASALVTSNGNSKGAGGKGGAGVSGHLAPAAAAAARSMARMRASKPLPAHVLNELRASFALFDLNGDGRIDGDEMRQAVRSLGGGMEDEEALGMADTDGDGLISFEEYVSRTRGLYDDSGLALRAAFDLFDKDGSGDIDRSELSVMLRKLGFEWQGAHVFEAADTNGDGKVSFGEFVSLFGKVARENSRSGG